MQPRLLKIVILVLAAGWVVGGGYLLVGRNTGSHPNIAVWIATRNVAAGVAVDATDVRKQDESAEVSVVGLRSSTPVGAGLVFAHPLKAGDMLRDDDVASANEESHVPISFKRAPDLQPGDSIDIYVVASGGISTTAGGGLGQPGTQLLARGVRVVTGGSGAVIAVPSWEEPLWTAVAVSDKALYAVLSAGVGVPSGNQHVYGVDDAVSQLSCVAAAAAGTSPPCASGSTTVGAAHAPGTSGG
jgi:hypothetical protein